MSPLSALGIGLFLGMRHALDPDHVLTVSNILSREKRIRPAAIIGILWGIGHTVTVVLVGIAIIIFGITIPPRVGLTMELAVSFVLIGTGIATLTGISDWLSRKIASATHAHIHFHGKEPHLHIHEHATTREEETGKTPLHLLIKRFGLFGILRPVAIGLMHGLAGSAAIALLVLTTINNRAIGILYLGIFGAGTVVGMVIVTTILGIPFSISGKRFAGINRIIRFTSGILSIVLGIFIAYEIIMVGQLFGASPSWNPH